MAQTILPNFPAGPLDRYRKLSSFDWKKMKIFLYTEEGIDFQNRLCDELQKHPSLSENNLTTPTLEEQRRAAVKNMYILKTHFSKLLDETKCIDKLCAYVSTMYCYNFSAAVKYSLTFDLFHNAVKALGTERHEDILKKSKSGDILGCFCLTEIGHGSNTKGMRTTATYDANTKEFILNSPDFESAKCWAGSLGQTACYAVIFAQLVTSDGSRKGLHAFAVQIRDPKTLLPHIGVKIFDMGEKMGINGFDNGVVMFDHFRIPRTTLLNKNSDVLEDGTYATVFEDENKRHGATFVSLSDGRLGICSTNMAFLIKATTIAIRYAAVRKQFGSNDEGEEIPILEYQTHQHRLLPYLASAYVLQIFARYLLSFYGTFYKPKIENGFKELIETSLEIHALSSAAKPLYGWLVRDAIQECREACAGHGYLKAAGFKDMRNDQHASCTYEGENHVLVQQTSNWLLKFWSKILKRQQVKSPLGTINFLNNSERILNQKFTDNSVEDLADIKRISSIYQWLICYLLKSTYEKIQDERKQHPTKNAFEARNESQVYYAKNLAIAYVEHLIIQVVSDKISQTNDASIRNILTSLLALFANWSLVKHIPTFYMGGYATNPSFADLIQKTVLKLCKEIKNESVSLVDVLAPPDFVLNSVLGCSDGLVYKHLESSMLNAPGALSRPTWWKEIVYWKNYQSKL